MKNGWFALLLCVSHVLTLVGFIQYGAPCSTTKCCTMLHAMSHLVAGCLHGRPEQHSQNEFWHFKECLVLVCAVSFAFCLASGALLKTWVNVHDVIALTAQFWQLLMEWMADDFRAWSGQSKQKEICLKFTREFRLLVANTGVTSSCNIIRTMYIVRHALVTYNWSSPTQRVVTCEFYESLCKEN